MPQRAVDQLVSNSNELHAIHLNEASPHRRIAFIVRPNYAGVANIEILMKQFNQDLTQFFKK